MKCKFDRSIIVGKNPIQFERTVREREEEEKKEEDRIWGYQSQNSSGEKGIATPSTSDL